MITVYCHAKCSTCKKALQWLDERGVPYTTRDIKADHPDEQTLRALHRKSALPLRRFFNTSGTRYRELNLSEKRAAMSEDEQFTLLASDGMLVKRPILIVERGGETTVIPGFKEGEWEAALSAAK